METYRLSSKLQEREREYLIQTANDNNQHLVSTTIFVNGRLVETVHNQHATNIAAEEVASLVNATHDEWKKDVDALLQCYAKARQTRDTATMYHLGTAFFFKAFYEESIEMFTAVLALSPDNHQAMNYLGLAHLAIGRTDEAVRYALAAAEQRPQFADYHNNLGEALLAANTVGRAIVEFETAISINLYYGDAYFNLGIAYLQQMANEPARPQSDFSSQLKYRITDALSKAKLISSSYATPALDAAQSLLERGEWRPGLETLKRIRQEKKDAHRQEFASFHMKFILHPDFISEKAIEDRINRLNAELRKNPGYIDLISELGQCYIEQSKMLWQKGMDQYRKALQLNPELAVVSASLESALNTFKQMNTCKSEI